MEINGQNIDKGVNINDKRQAFTDQILSLSKDIETRNSNSLRSLIGKRVALIKTGCGKAHIVGLATITGVKVYKSLREFRKDYHRHLVGPGSKYDIRPDGVKYGYILEDVERCDPIPVMAKGIVIRNI